MAHFVRHERCERCAEIGNDRSGDNKAVYSDGSSYCFACGKYQPPDSWFHISERTERRNYDIGPTKALPSDYMNYYLGFLPRDIIVRNFTYSPKLNRSVFTYTDPETQETFVEARSLSDKPKVLSLGKKPLLVAKNGVCGHFNEWDELVLVEDLVSALKVSIITYAMPLFGSVIPQRNFDWIFQSKGKSVLVWLDPDKLTEAVRMAFRLSNVGKSSRVIPSERDPKCYDIFAIKKILYQK
jgi:hypothetical protein